MAKSDRILDLFPSFYRAADVNKLLGEVVRQLARPLEEADTHLFRIQRAHRLPVAEHPQDILGLAAALNLTEFHFEDILNDQSSPYSEKLTQMRERVQRVARLHLLGLGTPWAVCETAAIFLNAVIVSTNREAPLIKHLDSEGYSHRAEVEFTHQPGKPRGQILLHENPWRRRKIDAAALWQLDSWQVGNESVAPAPVRIAVQGNRDHTVFPSLFCLETGEGLIFRGVVPHGQVLLLDAAEGATLEGEPVDDWVNFFRGAISDYSRIGTNACADDVEDQPNPFDGDREVLESHPFQTRSRVPQAPIGRSSWVFKIAEGIYDGPGLFDFACFASTGDPIGIYDGDRDFDACVFDYPPCGVVGMAWDERIACAFKLLLPPIPSTQTKGGNSTTRSGPVSGADRKNAPLNSRDLVSAILPRFKPAGVSGFVDMAADTWILGTSVLRNREARDGEGVESHTTTLHGPRHDMLVS